jgi:hypothetical protein
MLGVLDSADDAGPEAGPVAGLGAVLTEAQGAMEESADSPDIVGFTLTPCASAQVCGDGFGTSVLERSIEICADAAAGQQAGQHDHWTREAPTRILMAAHDT